MSSKPPAGVDGEDRPISFATPASSQALYVEESLIHDSTPLLTDAIETPLLATPLSNAQLLPANYYPYVPILCGILSIVADFGGGLTVTPEVRMLEMAVCRDYYRIHDPTIIGPPPYALVDEKLCKLDPIQVKLAYIRAWQNVLTTIPGLLLTIPFGFLADKYGRKPILLLGMTGHLLSYLWVILVCYNYNTFATEWVLISFVFLFLGGGVRILSAIINCMIVDVSPEGTRTTTFYLIGAAVHITDIVAPPIGSWLLSKNVWLPYKFGTPILFLSYLVILAMPETQIPSKLRGYENEVEDPEEGSVRPLSPRDYSSPKITNWSLRHTIQSAINILRELFSNRNIITCFTIVFMHSLATQSGHLILQFVSKRFDWPLARAGYLLSIKAFVAVAVLLVIVPAIYRYAGVDRSKRSFTVDLRVTRVSLLLLLIGNCFIGSGASIIVVITGMILCSAGTSVPQAMQGLVAAFVDPSATARIFAALAFIELVGTLIGGLTAASLFNLGIKIGASNLTLGLPYWGSALLFLVTILCSYFIRH